MKDYFLISLEKCRGYHCTTHPFTTSILRHYILISLEFTAFSSILSTSGLIKQYKFSKSMCKELTYKMTVKWNSNDLY